jgi:hypothetical protein
MVRFLDSNGVEQAVAPMSALKYLSTGNRARDAELLRDQIIRLDQAAKLMASRADVAIAQSRADAAEGAANQLIASHIARLQDSVLRLAHRCDALERSRAKRALDALPDPETAGVGDLQTILPPSEPDDRAHLESMIHEGRGDTEPEGPAGESSPPLRLDVPASSGISLAPPERADGGHVCRRDRKAARRAWIREQRKRS